MKKILWMTLLLAASVASCFAQPIQIPKTWVASETIKAADLNADMDFLYGAIFNIASDNFDPNYTIPTSKIQDGEFIDAHHGRHDVGGADAFTASDTIAANVTGTCSGNITGPLTIASAPVNASDPVNLDYFTQTLASSTQSAHGELFYAGRNNLSNVWLGGASWTCPVNTVAFVTLIGGGAGGTASTGGGAGGWAYRFPMTLASGTTYDVIPGVEGSINGNGGDSTFKPTGASSAYNIAHGGHGTVGGTAEYTGTRLPIQGVSNAAGVAQNASGPFGGSTPLGQGGGAPAGFGAGGTVNSSGTSGLVIVEW